jgi:gamma-glutamyltranspeptidase/glutathione hydrolase
MKNQPPQGRRKPTRETDTELLELSDRRIHTPQRVAVSSRGMVSTAHYSATAAGVEMLEKGGNAIDAAIAAAVALGVCEPAASGLGGQTMMLVHHAESRKTFALDGSSRAPNRAVMAVFGDLKTERRRGYRATTVPSSPATYDYALSNYGRLKWSDVFEPAIRLAEEGYEISLLQHRLTRRERVHLRSGTAARFFLRDGTRPYPAGTVFRQPVLANTLRRIAAQGVDEFYLGETAELIHRDMEAHGGLLGKDDLAQRPQPIERRPVTTNFEGSRVFTMPPPGAGRTLIEMINVYQNLPSDKADLDTPQGAVLFAETIRRAFLDRQDRPYDPNFYSQVSGRQMLSQDYSQRVAKQVTKRILGHGETTHLSVMDKEGNVVALTQSIENVFGSCCATKELGFLYNNYMNAFEYEDVSHPYYLRPNANPWASVAPTILFRGRRPWIAIGSPGSDRITPSILQVLLRLKNSTPLAAVDAPRLHCSLTGKVSLEASRMRDDIPAAMGRHGFQVDVREPYSFYLGCVQVVMREKGGFIGVADPRRDGAAGGPKA